jgi:hypothetical protein
VDRVRFWLGVVAASLTLGAAEVPSQVAHETFVHAVQVETVPDLWDWEPLPMDVEEHAQCMIDLIDHLGLDLTVQNLFIVGDYADLQGGPCGLLP